MSDSPRTALEAALTGHYAIERELGRGGMATVWLAREFASLRGSPRFERLAVGAG